jgi:hypothetical protein
LSPDPVFLPEEHRKRLEVLGNLTILIDDHKIKIASLNLVF